VVFVTIFSCGFAQIPNYGFENWTQYGNGMKPEGWWTPNDSLSPSCSYFPITRSTDHFPESIGEYSLRLENNPMLSEHWAQAGIIWPGDWNGNNNASFAITGHPTSLRGYYKFFPQNGDTMDIHFVLYKNGVEITGGGFMSKATTASWTAFSAIVSSTDYTEADSARIMISAFNTDSYPNGVHGNSVLFIDNLSFDNLIGAVPAHREEFSSFLVWPNPATGSFTFSLPGFTNTELTLKIYNVIGKLVRSQVLLHDEQQIDCRGLINGIYFVELSSGNWTGVQRIIFRN